MRFDITQAISEGALFLGHDTEHEKLTEAAFIMSAVSGTLLALPLLFIGVSTDLIKAPIIALRDKISERRMRKNEKPAEPENTL